MGEFSPMKFSDGSRRKSLNSRRKFCVEDANCAAALQLNSLLPGVYSRMKGWSWPMNHPRTSASIGKAGGRANGADELRLLERIKGGDRAAFEQLYRIYHPRLTRFLLRSE